MSKNKSREETGRSKRRFLIPVAVLAVIISGIWLTTQYFRKGLFTVMKVPDFELTNQNSQKVSSKSLLGKVYLVEFFYSTCPTICPVMNGNMKYIQKEINSPDFEIVSISIDPANDTPEILKQHAESLGADSGTWHFLTGNRSYIGDLADHFNIYVGDDENESESLNHSGMIALVDKNGNIRCRYNAQNLPILYYSGLNYSDPEGKISDLRGRYHPDREFLIEDIRKLLK